MSLGKFDLILSYTGQHGESRGLGSRPNIKTVFLYKDFHIKIRWSGDRLIFIMGTPILVRRYIYIETGPWYRLTPRLCLKVKTVFMYKGILI